MNRLEAKKWILEKCGKGWLGLIDEVFDNLPAGIEIIQVYQKYAGFCVDINPASESFEDFLADIEERSCSLCEICGKEANQYEIQGWEYTRCVDHCENGVDLTDPVPRYYFF